MVQPHERSITRLKNLKYATKGDRTLFYYIGIYMILIGRGLFGDIGIYNNIFTGIGGLIIVVVFISSYI